MKVRSKLFATVLVIGVLALAVSWAPAEAVQPAEEPTRTQIVIGLTEEPEVMDVQQASWSGLPHQLISQPPVMYDMEMKEILPSFLESWEVSEDGKVFTLHLPEGSKYSNGDPLDAQAMADSMQRYADPDISMYPEDLGAMVETNVIDDSTLEVVFSEPQAAIWLVFSTEWGAPWDAAEAERVGNDEFARMPVSNGLFHLDEWVSGSHMLMSRNEDYQTSLPLVENQGPAYLEEVLIRFIPEALTRVSELEAGTVDIIHDVPPSELDRLQADPNIDVLQAPTPGVAWLVINHQRPPFDDLRVRKAIAMAINRDDLAKGVDGTIDPVYSFLAPAQICHSEEIEQYSMEQLPYDVEAAKELLAEAGWTDTDGDGIVDKDGEPLSVGLLSPSDDPPREKTSVVLQSQLKEIGIDLSIEQVPYDYITSALYEGEDFDLAFEEMVWNDPDCLSWMYDQPKYDNPELVDKLDQGRYTPDIEARCAIYDDVQKTWLDDVFGVPLFTSGRYLAARTWLNDLIMHGPMDATFLLNDVTIQE